MDKGLADIPGTTTTETAASGEAMPCKASGFVGLAIWLIALPAGVATFLGFAGRWHWMVDLSNHARAQYAVALLMVFVLALLARRWRTAGLIALPLVVNLCFIAPFLPYASQDNAATDDALRLVHMNVNTRNGSKQAVAAYLRDCDADLIFTQEVSQAWLDVLESALSQHVMVVAEPRDDNFGIAMFVRRSASEDGRLTIDSTRIATDMHGHVALPAIDARVTFRGKPISILSIHPLPPMRGRNARSRDDALRSAAQWANTQPNAAIIIGDLNATPWSVHFRDMLREAELVNSLNGWGPGMTWPAGRLGDSSLTMIPIDHCLHTPALTTIARSTGPSHGSDHRALQVSLATSEPRQQAVQGD